MYGENKGKINMDPKRDKVLSHVNIIPMWAEQYNQKLIPLVPGSSPGWSRVFEGETARRPIQMLIRDNKEE